VLAGTTQRCRPGALALGSLLLMLASSCAGGDQPRLDGDEAVAGVSTSPIVADVDDAALVDACVQWVPIAAFSGDVEMAALWDTANHDVAVLADHCRALTTSRRLALRQMADELHTSPPAGAPVDAVAPDTAPRDEAICAVIPASGETICVDA
jgi:hypothetical protein